jgi:plastocyanin
MNYADIPMRVAAIVSCLLLFGVIRGLAANHTVVSSGFTFSPDAITINQGDTVTFVLASFHNAQEVTLATWNANDTTHTSGFFVPFGGGSTVLTVPGIHYYVCKNHAPMGMKGTITVIVPAPPAPALILPANHSSIASTSVTLVWGSVSVATFYRLQVAADSLFSSLVLDDSTLTDTSKQLVSLAKGTTYYWHVNAGNDLGSGSFSDAWSFAITDTALPGSPHVSAGWNMVSVPVMVSDFLSGAVFPTAASKAFAYRNGYILKDTLVNGTGYWLKFPLDSGLTISGTVITADTVAVEKGWNMVGSITQPVAAATLTSIPGGIVTTGFYGYAGAYQPSDTIRPGYGYWVKANKPGSIIMSSSPALSKTNAIKIIPDGELPPPPPTEMSRNSAADLPGGYALDQAFPNPFNPTTRINYQLPFKSRVTLKVYDMLGQTLTTLTDEVQNSGFKSVEWNANNAASGIYFYRLQAVNVDDPAQTYSQVRKMVLIK